MSRAGTEWSATVDEALRSRLWESAKLARENAAQLLAEAVVLRDAKAFARAGALAISSEEESSKAFVLSFAARDGRWDSALHAGLRDHGSKQAISQAMLRYAEIIRRTVLSQIESNPLAASTAAFALLSDQTQLAALGGEAMKRFQDRKQRDRLRQRFLYVAIDKNGSSSSRPETASAEDVEDCIADARTFLNIADVAIDPVNNRLA